LSGYSACLFLKKGEGIKNTESLTKSDSLLGTKPIAEMLAYELSSSVKLSSSKFFSGGPPASLISNSN